MRGVVEVYKKEEEGEQTTPSGEEAVLGKSLATID